MADEFQGEVCGWNWWNSSRILFGSSPCSSGIHDLGGFGWPNDLLGMRARSSDESGSASDGSIVIQDIQKPNQIDSPVDSSLQIMGTGLNSSSSTTHDWNRALLHGNGTSETNYATNPNPMLQEDHNSSINYRRETGLDYLEKNWSVNLNNFSTIVEDSSMVMKPVNHHQNFTTLDQKPLLSSVPNSTHNQPCTTTTATTSQGLSTVTNFPVSSVSYGYSSTLLETLFDSDIPQPQQSSYQNRRMIEYAPPAITNTNYQTNLNDFSPSLVQFPPLAKQVLPKCSNPLNFSTTNTNFWNASAASLNDFRSNTNFPLQSQLVTSTFSDKTCDLPNLLTTKSHNGEVAKGMSSLAKKTSCNSAEPTTFKRPRIETPSPLPTFKVRKEKLGDRITALQQLVSPFGKTDTASVLHEAIEYIKFLHDQVSVLSTPYLKNGSHIHRQQASADKSNMNQEGSKQDLKGRGLCLVPISSTFPVAAETATDFWTPTFGATFR